MACALAAHSLNNFIALVEHYGIAYHEKTLGQLFCDHKASDILAMLLADQGKYAEAEPLYRRSLAIREKEYGPNHPKVAVAVNNLALLLKVRGSTT